MKKSKFINEGGINGLGESLINTNSQEFIDLKKIIKSRYDDLGKQETINNGLLSVRFQMESYLNSDNSTTCLHAGDFIEKFLEVVDVKKKELAAYIGYEYSNLIALIKGRRKVNSEMAIKLGQIFKVEPVLWLHIESKNELMKELVDNKDKKEYTLRGLLKRVS